MENFTDEDINQFFVVALKLVEDAGGVVRDAIDNHHKKVSEKLKPTDLVTETDKMVEDMLVRGLKSRFPSHEFIGEENMSEQGTALIPSFSAKPTWIIDPIDGTMNFVHSNPLVTISVALAINRKLVMGIIAAPCIGKVYTAIKGQGAKLNGKPITVSDCKSLALAQCILEVWSRDGAESEAKQVENFRQIIPVVHSLRTLGSAALNLAFVGGGHADIYCHNGLHVWDFAAGAVIVSEAGGVVLDSSGKQFDLMSRRILVASSQTLADEWLSKVDFKSEEFPREYDEEICPFI